MVLELPGVVSAMITIVNRALYPSRLFPHIRESTSKGSRIAQSEHNVCPIVTVDGVTN